MMKHSTAESCSKVNRRLVLYVGLTVRVKAVWLTATERITLCAVAGPALFIGEGRGL